MTSPRWVLAGPWEVPKDCALSTMVGVFGLPLEGHGESRGMQGSGVEGSLRILGNVAELCQSSLDNRSGLHGEQERLEWILRSKVGGPELAI